MMNINIDISNTLIGSYSLDAIYNKVQITFIGIPEEWRANRMYASFVQDNLNPTVEVIDNTVSVPSEILITGTDFYIGLYYISYANGAVGDFISPIRIEVNSIKSKEFDIYKLAELIMKQSAEINIISSSIVEHSDNYFNPHNVTKEQIDLGNVDNTSDMDKPVSNAAQDEFDNKVDKNQVTNSYEEWDDGKNNIASLDFMDVVIWESIAVNNDDVKVTEISKGYPESDGIYFPTVNAVYDFVYPTPITIIPTTLEANKQYNFGEVTELSLAFPTSANDGDVIYLTFMSGDTPATLTVDTTNTCDIEVIPEANTGYEIFGKYNGSIWIVNYSEYTVSEV